MYIGDIGDIDMDDFAEIVLWIEKHYIDGPIRFRFIAKYRNKLYFIKCSNYLNSNLRLCQRRLSNFKISLIGDNVDHKTNDDIQIIINNCIEQMDYTENMIVRSEDEYLLNGCLYDKYIVQIEMAIDELLQIPQSDIPQHDIPQHDIPQSNPPIYVSNDSTFSNSGYYCNIDNTMIDRTYMDMMQNMAINH